MTAEEFNKKYIKHLEPNHYGAEGFNNYEFLDWLDKKFENFVEKHPSFVFSQIKIKFGSGRFYCENLPIEEILEIENKITEYYNK